MNWNILWTVGAVGFFRAFVGWFKNSVEDGKIQDVEWKKLAETFAIFLTIGIVAMLAGSTVVEDTTIQLIGVGAAFLINELWNAWKKKSTKKAGKKKKA